MGRPTHSVYVYAGARYGGYVKSEDPSARGARYRGEETHVEVTAPAAPLAEAVESLDPERQSVSIRRRATIATMPRGSTKCVSPARATRTTARTKAVPRHELRRSSHPRAICSSPQLPMSSLRAGVVHLQTCTCFPETRVSVDERASAHGLPYGRPRRLPYGRLRMMGEWNALHNGGE